MGIGLVALSLLRMTNRPCHLAAARCLTGCSGPLLCSQSCQSSSFPLGRSVQLRRLTDAYHICWRTMEVCGRECVCVGNNYNYVPFNYYVPNNIFEGLFSKLSENHSIASTVLKLWLLKDVQLHPPSV